MTFTLLHNPRCSKSREALAILRDENIDVKVVEYLNEPLTPAALTDLIAKLGDQVSALIRRKDAESLGLEVDGSREALVAALTEHPQLMERPILIGSQRAVIGRPPEKIKELF